ncbi:G2/mitotic-specific cyclin-B3-like isoform X2 [Portunus trituberculatus]|uniref:G2/mitotic-specific cyclin-B3-like isoform X2 n=1 Tax=Portunus trituberculatus TaxID=210409 RepID=UPI001E1CC14F|nr:G2/mitotic-specific cyclin-B3-like isoform X2 [Portunus trituberculatus]
MNTRPATRGLTARPQNENLTRPPLPGRAHGPSMAVDKAKVLTLKRKAEGVPEGTKAPKKRSALGEITNAIEKKLIDSKKGGDAKKVPRLKRSRSTVSLIKVAAGKATINKEAVQLSSIRVKGEKLAEVQTKDLSKAAGEGSKSHSKDLTKDVSFCDMLPSSLETASSQESKGSMDDSALYITASEGSPLQAKVVMKMPVLDETTETKEELPEGVEDFDQEMKEDPTAVANYANHIFKYYREREKKFVIEKYIERQPDVMRSMRAILVDWMVEVQESFELNHETLYLGVKILDLYLTRVIIKRDTLQLIGSTALFIACKFDERTPPYVDDFLYICDDAYNRKELLAMEIKILKEIEFDLGVPLSYRFLRRYARCAKVGMEDLTFTRYILEMSLMDYDLIDCSDSALAAAALLLSRCIKGEEVPWTATLEYYSGYKMEDIYHLTQMLHSMMCQPPKEHLSTIRNKYSHKVFYEVAKIPIPEKLPL